MSSRQNDLSAGLEDAIRVFQDELNHVKHHVQEHFNSGSQMEIDFDNELIESYRQLIQLAHGKIESVTSLLAAKHVINARRLAAGEEVQGKMTSSFRLALKHLGQHLLKKQAEDAESKQK
jgi:uncharacterized membrane-anchored protein YhcB (DUF1043 family)